jgi:hypothetical protein
MIFTPITAPGKGDNYFPQRSQDDSQRYPSRLISHSRVCNLERLIDGVDPLVDRIHLYREWRRDQERVETTEEKRPCISSPIDDTIDDIWVGGKFIVP